MLPVAVDAMGGDHAPDVIVAGARRAADELGVPVVLVGDPARLGDAAGLDVLAASEVIEMSDDPAAAVRQKKDASLNVAAKAVRDGLASAMVSAGNTGATMGSALLRMGRIKGVARPAIATPIPRPGFALQGDEPHSGHPTVLLDAGANADCQASWLVQFAQMGAVFARLRYGIDDPSVAMLSIGEEKSKGNELVKEAHALLAAGAGVRFVGNVEGRDLLTDAADVVVCDGFTGNVALKTLEGGMKQLVSALFGVFGATDETKAAADVLLPHLLPLYGVLDPNNTGGALLLGVDGVCVISHGSSNDTAIVNAVQVAAHAVEADLVGGLRDAVAG